MRCFAAGGLLNGKISLARIHNMSPHMDVYFNFYSFQIYGKNIVACETK